MRRALVVAALIFVGTINLYSEPTPFAKDTLALRMILDTCYPGADYNIWLFIKAAPWLTNQSKDTAGGRIRALSFLSLPTLPARIGSFDSLEILYLGGKHIYGSGTKYEASPLPVELFSLPNLKFLTLFARNLDTLPADIGKLVNLTHLVARFNSISYLPEEIGNLQSLQNFDLSENKLTKIPNSIGNLINLSMLDISFNVLDNLPPEIGKLSNLAYGFFDNNNLKTVPMEIGRCSNLAVYLRNNELSSLPDSIIHIRRLLDVDSNSLCSLTCHIQAYIDTAVGASWRTTQRCVVIPVPPCNTIGTIQPALSYTSINRFNSYAAIYDLHGRFLGTTHTNQLPTNLRTGIYFLRSTGATGRIVKQCVVK